MCGTATASMLDDAASRRRNSHGPKEGPADKAFPERERERQAFEREAAASKQSAAVEVRSYRFESKLLSISYGGISDLCAGVEVATHRCRKSFVAHLRVQLRRHQHTNRTSRLSRVRKKCLDLHVISQRRGSAREEGIRKEKPSALRAAIPFSAGNGGDVSNSLAAALDQKVAEKTAREVVRHFITLGIKGGLHVSG